MDSAVWTVECGQWAVKCGQWVVDSGQWKNGSGQWKMGSEMWTVGSGQWAVDKSMKLLPSDVNQSHDRPKHHSSDWSQEQYFARFFCWKSNKTSSCLNYTPLSSEIRTVSSTKIDFVVIKIPLCSVTAWWPETEMTDSDIFICSFHLI